MWEMVQWGWGRVYLAEMRLRLWSYNLSRKERVDAHMSVLLCVCDLMCLNMCVQAA